MQFDLRSMMEHMGGVAWGVVATLVLMSVYSIGVMIERFYTYQQATKQSRKYAPEVARFLKQGKIKEAIDASHGPTVKHSHLAKVLVVGLQEWQYQQEIGEADRDKEGAVDAAKRAIQRATAVNLADLKRGLSGLATIGSTAPFVGLFGTTFGIINAFAAISRTGAAGIRPSGLNGGAQGAPSPRPRLRPTRNRAPRADGRRPSGLSDRGRRGRQPPPAPAQR